MTTPVPVPLTLIEALAAEAPGSEPTNPKPLETPAGNGVERSRLLVARWLDARGVAHRVKREPDARGRTVYVLAACPFDATHADPDACIMQAPDGQMSARCFHNSCHGRGWQAFKDALGKPDRDHYDPPLGAARRRARIRQSSAVVEGPLPGDAAEPAPDEVVADPATPARREVVIDPKEGTVADTMREITDVLIQAGDCFRRADQVVRVAGAAIRPVLGPAELGGLLNRHAEVVFPQEESRECRPLPVNYAQTWLNHPDEIARLPPITLFTLNPVFTLDWSLADAGYDAESGIYHAGPAVEPRPDTEHLDRLLADFCFRTPGDRTNYVGMLLTALLMPRFIGSKPAVLFNGNQPGLGKTILAQMIAILRDGQPTPTASFNPNDEEFEKRLGALVRRGATTLIIDNAKKTGRCPRIESACLERSLTDAVLSFRLLGQSSEIRAENSHIVCLTANTPDVGPDIVSRSVVVELFHEGNPKRRSFAIADPEGYAEAHRHALLGELIGLVERWKAAGSPEAAVHSRFNKKGWGRIVGGILAHAGLPDFLANADQAAHDLDDGRREFAQLVALLADQSRQEWTGSELAELAVRHRLFRAELEEASPHARATRMGLLAGRFVDESFALADGCIALFRRTEDRKGKIYHVELVAEDIPA